MRVIYFAHDLNEAGVAKRVAMFREAGIDVTVAGFWRGEVPPRQVEGAPVVPLARTLDARLVHRAAVALGQAFGASRLAERLGPADVLMARNLEMLTVAVAFRNKWANPPALALEILDIHRTLLGSGLASRALRAFERHLLNAVDLLVVSSPAFLREYYEPVQRTGGRIVSALVENKLLVRHAPAEEAVPDNPIPSGPPWRIGWFGIIRCERSLAVLTDLARRRPDLVQVEIRGRPTRELTNELERIGNGIPALSFKGPYAFPDLPRLYRSVHFCWAIDYYEDGGNSNWLLPNRIYEGGCCGAVPFAIGSTETGRWLNARGLGLAMERPEDELEAILEGMTAARYSALKAAGRSVPRSHFVADHADSARLRRLLEDTVARPRAGVPEVTRIGALQEG